MFSEKYFPETLDDFYLPSKTKKYIQRCIDTRQLNFFFISDTGCGKTSLIKYILQSTNVGDDNIFYVNSIRDQTAQMLFSTLQMFCQTSTISKYKYVVIDNVDTLSEQIQQYISHVISNYILTGSNTKTICFIISCTDLKLVSERIYSYFAICRLPSIQTNDMEDLIVKICKNEQLQVTIDAQKKISNICNANIPLMLNYLEKIRMFGKKINESNFHQICTNIDSAIFINFFKYIREVNVRDASLTLYNVYEQGYSTRDIYDDMLQFIKHTDILTEDEKYKTLPILCDAVENFLGMQEDELELAILSKRFIGIFTLH